MQQIWQSNFDVLQNWRLTELTSDKINVRKILTCDKKSFDNFTFDKMSFDKLTFDKLTFDKMSFDKINFWQIDFWQNSNLTFWHKFSDKLSDKYLVLKNSFKIVYFQFWLEANFVRI